VSIGVDRVTHSGSERAQRLVRIGMTWLRDYKKPAIHWRNAINGLSFLISRPDYAISLEQTSLNKPK
jgi:hypothetical protein